MSVLPFETSGEVRDRSGALVAEVGCSKPWKVRSTSESGGQTHDYAANCTDRGELVGRQNLLLTVEGEEYRIVDATPLQFLPYTELTLRQVLPNG
jgi:hypothetical protein